MSFAAASSSRRGLLAIAWLALLSWWLRPMEALIGGTEENGDLQSPSSAALLGGMRSAAAGAVWLRAHRSWESYDFETTLALIELAVATDERPLFYWLNGARIMAYDFPAWEIDEAMPVAVQRRLRAAGAARALSFLEKARRMHSSSPDVLIEMAMLRMRVLGDADGAAELFREAALLPGAPYYAARIHAELLREIGRPELALRWLREILPGLPENDPAACRAVVVQRIKALEAELSRR